MVIMLAVMCAFLGQGVACFAAGVPIGPAACCEHAPCTMQQLSCGCCRSESQPVAPVSGASQISLDKIIPVVASAVPPALPSASAGVDLATIAQGYRAPPLFLLHAAFLI